MCCAPGSGHCGASQLRCAWQRHRIGRPDARDVGEVLRLLQAGVVPGFTSARDHKPRGVTGVTALASDALNPRLDASRE
jgi:hypothetical protein